MTVPTELVLGVELFRREAAPQPLLELTLAFLLPRCGTVIHLLVQLTALQGQELVLVMKLPRCETTPTVLI